MFIVLMYRVRGFLMVLLVWFLIHLSLMAIDNHHKHQVLAVFCPPRCKCNDIKLLVFCNHTQIDLVPIMLNPQLKELYLHGNRIKNIYSSFIVYQDLQYLDISNNLISDTGKKSFLMQKKLRVLLLNENQLTQINNLSFYGLDSLYWLDLSHNQLKDIQSRIFMSSNKLEWLDLSFNHISYINKEAFFGLLNLKRLNLHSNQLKQIPTQSLYHLQSLVKLQLGKNLFGHIPELAFSPLTMLEELMIDSCLISAINTRAFLHLSSLNYLDLQNNRLVNVPSESLSHVTTLKALNLSHNLITAIGGNAFKNLTHLQTLVVCSSPLSYIDKDAFIDNVNLTKLIIENNKKLNRIMLGTFAGQIHSLQYISLRANMISSLDWQTINYLKRLHYIDLQQNPLVCNCSLSWLSSYLKRSTIISTANKEQVKCYYPNHMYGKKLITLSDADLSCSKLLNTTIRTIVNIFTYVALIVLLLTMAIVICRRQTKQQQRTQSKCFGVCCRCFQNHQQQHDNMDDQDDEQQDDQQCCSCCYCCCLCDKPIDRSRPTMIVSSQHGPQYHAHSGHHMIINAGGRTTIPASTLYQTITPPTKCRLDPNQNTFYYPSLNCTPTRRIINDELARDNQLTTTNNNNNNNNGSYSGLNGTKFQNHYQRTMTNNNNNNNSSISSTTRTSALSVDLHPLPNRYVPIAQI